MDQSTNGICNVCRRPNGRKCSGCAAGLDTNGKPVNPTFYCSVECQRADYTTHKPACKAAKARLQLYRGGTLIQEMMYAFRETAFDLNIEYVRVEGNVLHIYEASYQKGAQMLFPFPDHLVLDPKDKQALLTFYACSDALIHFKKLFLRVVEGIAKDSKEVHAITETMPGRVERHFANGTIDNARYSHNVWVVPLKPDGVFVVDATGAQFRQYNPVTPLAVYQERYARVFLHVNPIGTLAGRAPRHYGDKFVPQPGKYKEDGLFDLHCRIAEALEEAVSAWESKAGKKVTEMLTGRDNVFEEEKTALLTMAVQYMRASIP